MKQIISVSSEKAEEAIKILAEAGIEANVTSGYDSAIEEEITEAFLEQVQREPSEAEMSEIESVLENVDELWSSLEEAVRDATAKVTNVARDQTDAEALSALEGDSAWSHHKDFSVE